MKKLLCMLLAVILSLGLLPGSVLAAGTGTIPDAAANAHEWRYIKFNANGGTGSMETLELDRGDTVTLPANTFTRQNYTFLCWNTEADGSGTSYADGATLVTVRENITLYAQWKGVVSITAKDVTVVKGKKLVLTATVKLGGAPAKGKTVVFKFNGKTYKKATDANGVAKVTLKTTKLKIRTYKYTASCGGRKTTHKVQVKGKTVITAKNVSVKKGKVLKLTAVVKQDGKPLKNKKVTFRFNGKTYTTKTNSNGTAVVKIKTKSLKLGKYKYSVTCEGKTIKRTALIKK